MPISIKDLISASMRNSPNFSGSPKVGGESIPSIGTDGEVKVNGQSIIVKTREYKLPVCWQNIAEYSLENFKNDLYRNGYGIMLYPYVGSSVIYIDPSLATSGTGSFANPYKGWPASIPNNSLILIKEYSTLVLQPIAITANNIMIGTYDGGTGERTIEQSKLATISFSASSSLFSLPTAGEFICSGVKFISSAENINNIISTSTSTMTVKIEYCVFANISSLVSGAISGYLFYIGGKLSARFNKVIGCTTNIFGGTNSSVIYGNEIIFSFSSPASAHGIKLSGSGYVDVHHNYISNQTNKGALVDIATTGAVIVRNNYLFGGKSDETGESFCITVSGSSQPLIHENIVCNGSYGILSPNISSKIYKNIVCSEYNNYIGISGGNVVGNTVVRLSGSNGIAVSSSTMATNNIIDSNIGATFDTGLRMLSTSAQINYNNINGSVKPISDSAGALIPVSGTNIATSSHLDYKFYPKINSSSRNSGSVQEQYMCYGNRGAIDSISGVGLSADLFSPSSGIATLQETIDGKADLASPAFIGAVSINGYTPQVTLFKDFGKEITKIVSGATSSTLGTYTLANIPGNSIIRLTIVYSTIGSGVKVIEANVNGITISETSTTAAKTSKLEIICSNNSAQAAQTYIVSTDGITNMSTSSISTTSNVTFTVHGTGTHSSDSIGLVSVIIEQI